MMQLACGLAPGVNLTRKSYVLQGGSDCALFFRNMPKNLWYLRGTSSLTGWGTIAVLDSAANWADVDHDAFAAPMPTEVLFPRKKRGLPADSEGGIECEILNSNCGSATALEAHTPPSNILACPMGYSSLPGVFFG